jgi:hypothetical protein
MLQPTEKLTITLEAQQWDMVMRLMSEGPFRVVAPLLAEIQAQCARQAGGAPMAAAGAAPGRLAAANGAADPQEKMGGEDGTAVE